MRLPPSQRVPVQSDAIVLWTFPVPATALSHGPHFRQGPGRQCELSFRFEGADCLDVQVIMRFESVEAYRCTYLTSLTAEMIGMAYSRVVDLGRTAWLTELLRHQLCPVENIRHLMICFDDGPCYEVACVDFTIHSQS